MASKKEVKNGEKEEPVSYSGSKIKTISVIPTLGLQVMKDRTTSNN